MKLPTTIWKPVYGEVLRTVLTTVAVAGVLIILINQQIAANNQVKANNESIRQLRAAVKELEANTNMKLADAQKHLDCIVSYFTVPGRTGNTTLDPANCQVTNPPAPKVTGVASPIILVNPVAPASPPLSIQPVTQPSLSSPPPSLSSSSPPVTTSPIPVPLPNLLKQILNFLGL